MDDLARVAKYIELRSLREASTYPPGRMLARIFASLAKYERTLIPERVEAALDATRSRGRQIGRPESTTTEQVQKARTLLSADRSRIRMARGVGVSRASV